LQWALFHRNGYSFRIYRAWNGNLLARLSAVGDIETHRFEDAFLGLFDGFAQPVYAGEVFAIRVVLATFAFDCDRVGVQSHSIRMLQEEE
jgi:hypothetical protein